jgi:hypothetical protein
MPLEEALGKSYTYYNASFRLGYLNKKGHITDVVSFAILTAKRPRSEPEQYKRKSYRNHLHCNGNA